jgi:hypothetical protein
MKSNIKSMNNTSILNNDVEEYEYEDTNTARSVVTVKLYNK